MNLSHSGVPVLQILYERNQTCFDVSSKHSTRLKDFTSEYEGKQRCPASPEHLNFNAYFEKSFSSSHLHQETDVHEEWVLTRLRNLDYYYYYYYFFIKNRSGFWATEVLWQKFPYTSEAFGKLCKNMRDLQRLLFLRFGASLMLFFGVPCGAAELAQELCWTVWRSSWKVTNQHQRFQKTLVTINHFLCRSISTWLIPRNSIFFLLFLLINKIIV